MVSSKDYYWISAKDIAKNNSLTIEELEELIKDNSSFARNKKGLYTTRKMYKKYTPFLSKFLDGYIGRIQ